MLEVFYDMINFEKGDEGYLWRTLWKETFNLEIYLWNHMFEDMEKAWSLKALNKSPIKYLMGISKVHYDVQLRGGGAEWKKKSCSVILSMVLRSGHTLQKKW